MTTANDIWQIITTDNLICMTSCGSIYCKRPFFADCFCWQRGIIKIHKVKNKHYLWQGVYSHKSFITTNCVSSLNITKDIFVNPKNYTPLEMRWCYVRSLWLLIYGHTGACFRWYFLFKTRLYLLSHPSYQIIINHMRIVSMNCSGIKFNKYSKRSWM